MEKVGKYQIKRLIGKGESGSVYLALDTFTSKDVALKILNPQVTDASSAEQAARMQFMTEASLAGRLIHPHIAAIYEASVQGEAGYIALEYVPGGDLSQYADPQSLLPPSDVIQIAFKICGALDYAFRQGIVHRDIKPANLLVADGTNIKISDFGAAYQFHLSDAPLSNIGSPYYMSPEQTRGEIVDHRSDMFSLGVVLYQLFTGRRPFSGGTLSELFATIGGELPAPPSFHRPEVGSDIDRIVRRMLAHDPAERYLSWMDVALDFAAAGGLSIYTRAIPDSEKFVALKRVHLLSHLNDGELWELVQAGKWSRTRPSTVIVREGDPGRSLFLIGSGHVKVLKQGRLLNVLSAGECVGEMAYVKRGATLRQATVETTEDVLMVEFAPEDIEKVSLKCRYQLTLALMHSLVDRLAMADARLVRAG